MKKYHYVLFDWDGTIAQTLNIWFASLKSTLEDHEYKLSDEQIGADYTRFAAGFREIYNFEPDEIVNKALHRSALAVPSVRLYPDVGKVLNEFVVSGKKLALITTSVHEQIDPLLIKYKLAKTFDVVVCGDDVRRQKPDPEPLLMAIRLMGANPEDTLMVGDSEKDLIAAKKAGIDSILFYPPEHEKFYDIKELTKFGPMRIVRDFEELLDHV